MVMRVAPGSGARTMRSVTKKEELSCSCWVCDVEETEWQLWHSENNTESNTDSVCCHSLHSDWLKRQRLISIGCPSDETMCQYMWHICQHWPTWTHLFPQVFFCYLSSSVMSSLKWNLIGHLLSLWSCHLNVFFYFFENEVKDSVWCQVCGEGVHPTNV